MHTAPNRTLGRVMASRALEVLKLRGFVPCDVRCHRTGFKARIIELVFDPLRIAEVNARFSAEGYLVGERMTVIAVTDNGSILLWGGANSVYHLGRGEALPDILSNIAFEDILHLTGPFRIKNTKAEIDRFISDLRAAETPNLVQETKPIS